MALGVLRYLGLPVLGQYSWPHQMTLEVTDWCRTSFRFSFPENDIGCSKGVGSVVLLFWGGGVGATGVWSVSVAANRLYEAFRGFRIVGLTGIGATCCRGAVCEYIQQVRLVTRRSGLPLRWLLESLRCGIYLAFCGILGPNSALAE